MQQRINKPPQGFQPFRRIETAIWRIGTLLALIVFLILINPQSGWSRPLSPLVGVATPLTRDRVDEISIEKIRQFIQAYLDVIQFLEVQQTQSRSNPEPALDQAALEKGALEIIEAAGLTRQEYLQLLNLVNTDRDFSDRVAMQLQEFGKN